MGNYKFRSIKLKVRVSGYMDILISNMYSPRPFSLNRKEGTTGDSFQWKNYKFGSVKLELGVSGNMGILILNTYPARSSSLRDNGTGNTLV